MRLNGRAHPAEVEVKREKRTPLVRKRIPLVGGRRGCCSWLVGIELRDLGVCMSREGAQGYPPNI